MSKSGVYSYSKSTCKNGFTRRCAAMLKEQRARMYILRRCATMLLCSYIQDDE